MVELEELAIIIPIIVGVAAPIVVSLMMRHLMAFDKNVDRSSHAIFNIETIQDEMKKIDDVLNDNREHFDKRIDIIDQHNEKREQELKSEIHKMWEKVQSLDTNMRIVEYRLNRINGKNSNH